jgi:hypothetical protein
MPDISYARQYGRNDFVFSLDGTGFGEFSVGIPPLDTAWLIERVLVQGSATGYVQVSIGGSVSDIGAFDPAFSAAVADNPSPIYVPQQQEVTIEVFDADANAVVSGYVQYRVLEGLPS